MRVARWQQQFFRLIPGVVLGALFAAPTVVIAEPPSEVLQVPLAQDFGLRAPHLIALPTVDLAGRLDEPGVVDGVINWAELAIPAQLEADNTLLPIEVEPGLQFSVDPELGEVFFGWRFQF